MDHPFRSAAFGGFNRQDVLDYLEKTAAENAQKQQELQRCLEEAEEDRRKLASQESDQEERVTILNRDRESLSQQLEKSPENALAVALTPRRSTIYRELILGGIDIVNDIRLVCLSDMKMTEKERIEILFGIRPKLRLLNRTLRRLTLAVKYTSLSDVWREIDCRAKSYDVDKWKITDEAFERWRGNSKIRPRK